MRAGDRAAAEGVGGGHAAHGLGRAYPICPVGARGRAVDRRQFPPVLPGEGLAPVGQGIARCRGNRYKTRGQIYLFLINPFLEYVYSLIQIIHTTKPPKAFIADKT